MTDTNNPMKTWWDKPEGKTGRLMLGVMAGAGLYGAYKLLPVLISLMRDTIYATVLAIILFGIIAIAMDPKVHNLISYGYRSAMRGLTKMFVNIDPISILKTYVYKLKKSREEMDEKVTDLRGQMASLKKLIDGNARDIENKLRLANQAQIKGNREAQTLNSSKAGRLKESNARLDVLYQKISMLYAYLSKTHTHIGTYIEDLEDEIRVKEQERNAITAGSSAFRSAMRVIHGGADQREIFDQAMESLVDDYAAKVGEIERSMERTDEFMSNVDLQNGVFEEKGMKMLEEWQQEGSVILGPEKRQLIAAAENRVDVLSATPASQREGVRITNNYTKLLEE